MNKKSFNIYLPAKKVFRLVIDGFTLFSGFIARIDITNTISAVMRMIVKVSTTISQTSTITVSKMLLRLKNTETISNINTIVANMRLRYKLTQTLSSTNTITATSRGLFKVSSPVAQEITIDPTMIVGSYFPLSDYDASTLTTLDSTSIGDLDAVLI